MPRDSVDRMVEAWSASHPGTDVSPLEVVGRLLLSAEHCRRQLEAALRSFELSFGDFDVINTLRRHSDQDGQHPSDLARSSLITTGAMTARLKRLERSGLITRSTDLGDGRAVRVHLTERGDQIARRALDAVLEADLAFLQPLNADQRETAAALLKRLLLAAEATNGSEG